MHNVTTDIPIATHQPGFGRWTAAKQFFLDHGLWMTSLFLAGLAGKFWLLFRFGTELPYWDAWEAEALRLYLPYFHGQLSWADLLQAHNEHRMLFPRLYCLGLLLLNGQWDNQFQTVVNAVIHSATLTALGFGMARLLGKHLWPLIWLPLALALALPFAWENTFGGGLYSQFYFLLAFSLIMIWFMGLRAPLSPGWWLGLIAGAATLFTAGSGFLTAVAVCGLGLLGLAREPRDWRKHIPTFIACGLLVVGGFLLKVDVPRHQIFHAHSLVQFLHALSRNLAWPCTDEPGCAVINLLPLALLAWMYLRSTGYRPAEKMVLGLGLWVLLQSAAAAYARGAEFTVGNEGSPPAPRYMDSSSFIMISDALSITLLVTRYRHRLWHPPAFFAGFVVWAVVCIAGLWATTASVWEDTLPLWLPNREARIQNTRAFVATDDPRIILDAPQEFALAQDLGALVATLREPDIRRVLPECVRQPLAVVPKSPESVFVPNGRPPEVAPDPPWEKCWGSFSANGAKARGDFESLPIDTAGLHFLAIPVSGDFSGGGISLELVDVVTGEDSRVRLPRKLTIAWQNVYVRAPAHAFKLIATDQSQTGWLAFQEPRDVGRFSYWALCFLAAWKYLLAAAVGLLLWGVLNGRKQLRNIFDCEEVMQAGSKSN